MFGLGPMELIIIFLIILLVFGAKRIPEIAQGLGKGITEFKRAARDITDEFDVNKNQNQSNYPGNAPRNELRGQQQQQAAQPQRPAERPVERPQQQQQQQQPVEHADQSGDNTQA